jgi:hypothetical protein
VETARRAFAQKSAGADSLSLWFAPDIPEGARRTLTVLIDRERTARGTWRGHGPVGVLVITDTATTIGNVPLPQRFDRERPVTTAVLAASAATGGRCVTIIRLRHRGLTIAPALTDDRLPLDGCAFTDAFGRPGPKIAEWVRNMRYMFARRLSFAPSTEKNKLVRYSWDEGDVPGRACRGGNDSSCVATAMFRDTTDWRFSRLDWSVSLHTESSESLGRVDFDDDVMLESLELDLGPARFQRVWQSPKALPDAYLDQTGETFASWERGRLNQFYGPYRIGSLPSPASNFLTIGLALLLAATTIRFTARPQSA